MENQHFAALVSVGNFMVVRRKAMPVLVAPCPFAHWLEIGASNFCSPELGQAPVTSRPVNIIFLLISLSAGQ